jgi:hypothetical protein
VVVVELLARVVDVVVVVADRPMVNVAYLSVNGEFLPLYHTPVNEPLNVGGRVCRIDCNKPESIMVRGVQVSPLSVERVA